MTHVVTLGDIAHAIGITVGLGLFVAGLCIVIGYLKSRPALRTPNADVAGCFGYGLGIIGIVIIAAMLAACQTAPVQTRTVAVNVPVPVQPIKPIDIPTPPPPLGKRPPSLQDDADLALAGHCRDVAWIIKAFPLLEVSAGLPPVQAPRYPECEKR